MIIGRIKQNKLATVEQLLGFLEKEKAALLFLSWNKIFWVQFFVFDLSFQLNNAIQWNSHELTRKHDTILGYHIHLTNDIFFRKTYWFLNNIFFSGEDNVVLFTYWLIYGENILKSIYSIRIVNSRKWEILIFPKFDNLNIFIHLRKIGFYFTKQYFFEYFSFTNLILFVEIK